jgi:peptide/nickel transport system substrate-binding protein
MGSRPPEVSAEANAVRILADADDREIEGNDMTQRFSTNRRDALKALTAGLLMPSLAASGLIGAGATEVWAATDAASERTLSLAIGGAVTTIDPHFYSNGPNNSVARHFFERLVGRTATAGLVPELALSWQAVSDTVWEFKLRPGVKWHDGKDFTADDVEFTIKRIPNVPNSPGGFAGLVRVIQKIEVVDPLTIRFHTPNPYPLLPTDLTNIGIVSRHVGEGASTADYNSGKAAIGTGPFVFKSYQPGARIEMVRNDNYWGPKPAWSKVDFRIISNGAARTAALLSGDVDLIDAVPTPDLQKLRQDARIRISETPSLRVIYLTLDRSRDSNVPFVSDRDGKPLPTNPFNDVRVRRALNISINRQALVDRIMEGMALPTGQWLPEGLFGYNPEVAVPAYNPDLAKKLLAEAGYPNGFRMTLHTSNDRYPNDAMVAQAVAQMWTRVGVQTAVEAVPFSVFSSRIVRQEFAAGLRGWGSGSGEASFVLREILTTYDASASQGMNNPMHYSNKALDKAIAETIRTVDDAKRETLLRAAVKMAADDVGIISLFMLKNAWASKKGIEIDARMDELTVSSGVRPVKG